MNRGGTASSKYESADIIYCPMCGGRLDVRETELLQEVRELRELLDKATSQLNDIQGRM